MMSWPPNDTGDCRRAVLHQRPGPEVAASAADIAAYGSNRAGLTVVKYPC